MANIDVNVIDGNNINLVVSPSASSTLVVESGFGAGVAMELYPAPTQVINIDRGVPGNGIASVSVIDIDGSQYLHITFTNGTTSDVGPIATSTYFGVSPIVVTGDQISLSTVPLTLGGTGATTASGARASIGLGSIATQNANAVAITGGSISGITDLAVADGGTGSSTAAGARTNLGLGTAAVLNAGVSNGVATLDSGGTVPLSQIPASIQGGVIYQGTWNATTNNPVLTSSVGTKGYYYVVSVAGSTNLNGITSWNIGDWAIFNGTAWEKIDNTDAVTSVNGLTGTVVITAASLGALTDITSTDGSVAITSPTATTKDLSVAVSAATTNVICQVRNTTGATLTKGTAVYITGATGQLPTVSKALATSDATSAQTLGLMTSDLPNNSNGNVTIIGLISDINTSAYADGEQLYLSPTTAGALTSTKPYAPNHLVYVAVVEHAHPTQGKLFVKVQNGYELDELHNVSAQTPVNGQTIVYNSSTNLWQQNTVSLTAGVNGTLPVLNGGTGTTTSTGTGSVVLSASPTLTTPNLGTPTSGNFSTGTFTWPTFNQSTTGNAATATTATTASNVSGGTASVTTLTASADSAFTSTGAVQLSSGTTAQRPAGAAGKLRFNTTTSEFEGYNGATWASVGGSAISNDTTTATNLYPLFASATTGTAANVYTSNAQYLFKPSTGELSVKVLRASNGIVVNSATISSDCTIATGDNATSSGPISVNSGVTVTVSSGSRWVVI